MSGFALSGRMSPPMENGEVVFEAPWQSRVFGMAVALSEQGLYPWSDFQQSLIDEVAVWDQVHPADENYPYFDIFQKALTNLLVGLGHLNEAQVDALSHDLAHLPHGHDH
ncbi:MAG: nitrile hydratase accessory protein [Pseudomonadota bacterium]